MEALLQELIDLVDMHRTAEEEQSPEEFQKTLTEVIHPLEDKFEQKVPGFYILWAEEYRMYGLFPVDR